MPHLWKTVSSNLTGLLARSLAKMSVAEVEMVAKHAFDRYRAKTGEALVVFCDMIHDLEDSAPNNLFENGEAWLLRSVKKLGFNTLFDVGANVGDWVNYAAEQIPDARIDCFEIVPATFEKLKAGVKPAMGTVRLNAFGLSDHDGQIPVFLADSDYISSKYEFKSDVPSRSIACQVRRGDAYAAENNIDRIDFVKIDVEGAEGDVIKGLSELLDRKAIRLVQFEYNRGAIESRFLLIDFYQFFIPRGYILGKLTQDGVKFRDYEYAFEDFNGPNYVACLATDRALIEAVSVKSI